MPPLSLLVVGDPVEHSLSPVIHNAALAALGIPGSYAARRVDGAGLVTVIDEMRRGKVDGVNVTMPHKAEAARLVDSLSPEASRAGSVNTIVRTPAGLVGHSTDVTGLRRMWQQRKLPEDGPVLVLGAGGAAAAAVTAVSSPVVYVASRRPDAASRWADEAARPLIPIPWGTAVADAVVVNATPLGMLGEGLPDLIVSLARGMVDLAYGQEPTPAVAEARRRGLATVDGLQVLVAQAADSFRLWTGLAVPEDVMEQALRNHSRQAPGAPNHHKHDESLSKESQCR